MVENLRVAMDKFPYNGQFGLKEIGIQADAIEQGGLPDLLKKKGCTIAESFTTKLTPDEETQYGEMHRMGLGHDRVFEVGHGAFFEGPRLKVVFVRHP